MRKFLTLLILSLGAVTFARASDMSYSTSVTNGVFVATTNVDLDLNSKNIDMLSVQLNVSSANAQPVTFIDGVLSSATISFPSSLTSLATAYATDTISINSDGAAGSASAQITIISTTGLSGNTLTFSIGAAPWITYTFTADTDFPTSGQTTTVAAANLAAVLQGYSLFTATNVANVVFATSVPTGLAPNSWTLVSSSPTVMSASATFTNGKPADLAGTNITVTINGSSLPTIGVPFGPSITHSTNGTPITLTEGKDWFRLDVASNAAISLCAALNTNFKNVFVSSVPPGSSVIASTSVSVGSYANAFAMKSSTSAMVVLTPTFTGGQDAAIISIAGYQAIANRDFQVGATSATTAINFMNYIDTNTSLNPMISFTTATALGSTVTIKSVFVGLQQNYVVTVSTPSILFTSFISGVNSDISLATNIAYGNILPNNPNISEYNDLTFPSNYAQGLPFFPNSIGKATTLWATGTPVLLTKTAGTYPTPLTDKTTYYAVNVQPTYFQLIDTASGAAAGLTLTFSTMTQAGGGSFTLTPLALTGTPTITMQTSDDDVNFTNLFVSTNPLVAPLQATISFASPYTATSQKWDVGNTFARWLRLQYNNAVNAGGVVINYIINGKGYSRTARAGQ